MALLKTWLSLSLFFTTFAFGVNFKTKKITVQNISIKAAVADTIKKRTHGLMFVESWKDYEAMVFIFESSEPRSFWMRNTILPLSLGFYDDQKKLFQIAKLNPAKSLAQQNVDSIKSIKPARYVLEVPQGWFEKNKIKIGSNLTGL